MRISVTDWDAICFVARLEGLSETEARNQSHNIKLQRSEIRPQDPVAFAAKRAVQLYHRMRRLRPLIAKSATREKALERAKVLQSLQSEYNEHVQDVMYCVYNRNANVYTTTLTNPIDHLTPSGDNDHRGDPALEPAP